MQPVNTFENTAKLHEAMAAGLQASIKHMPLASKAPIMREVAHHLECAARLRGQPLPPLSIKDQIAEGRRARRLFEKRHAVR